MELSAINTGLFKLDGGAMHGVVPKSMWQKRNPADENNLCTWAMRCLLIKDGDRIILIDTGLGQKQDEKFMSHFHPHGEHDLISSLAKQGVSPTDVTDVVLTHLHFDHCGGAIVNEDGVGRTTFPNAVYWSNEDHWDWAINPNAREKASFLPENILPIKESGQLEFLNVDQSPFSDVEFMEVHGHTKSQMIPIIHAGNNSIAYVADLIPSVAHLSIPWVMSYDVQPLLTLQEKNSFLERAVNESMVLMFEHDPTIECARLTMTDRGIRASETGALTELA